MRGTIEAHRDRDLILNKVKAQYEPGPMRHRLYEIVEDEGIKPPTPSYAWMYYAGMGDVGLGNAKPGETAAIEELIKDGRLVPTFEDSFYRIKKIRLIQHFDDVKFGFDEKGDILIYDFAHAADEPDLPDPVITPGERHEPALKKIKDRMNFSVEFHTVAIDDNPIRLRGGPVVRPIITDADQIELRRRQRDFTP